MKVNTILTPISLWKDFECNAVQAKVLSERKKGGLLYRETVLEGRQTESGVVSVYGMEVRAKTEEKLPALLLLLPANAPITLSLAERFARRGYCVFCMDYRGKTESSSGTVYPEDVAYAYYRDPETTVLHAREGAKKTAWYEWTAAARYAVQYLLRLPYVTSVGAMGIREGGDIVWKLMTFGDLSCGVCINAAGWLAYRDKNKYNTEQVGMDEDERLFIAGIDSQSYAPFVKCPVLMLVSVTDTYTDIDRAYDTYMRINASYLADSTIDYSIGHNGMIDEFGEKDADMFMDKYLKNREMFIVGPPALSFVEENDRLYVELSSDDLGKTEESFVCYAENSVAQDGMREWDTVKPCQAKNGKFRYALSPYEGAQSVFAFGRVRYSSGITVSSKITVKKTEKAYIGSAFHTNVLYDSATEASRAFFAADTKDVSFGVFLSENSEDYPMNEEGYGKISGATCRHGLKTYRISDGRYAPSEKAMLHFDIYAEEDCEISISVETLDNEVYTDTMSVCGGEKWQSYLAEASSLHNKKGTALISFAKGKSLTITETDRKKFIVTNILWI
jgi:dienelactone hydrolase